MLGPRVHHERRESDDGVLAGRPRDNRQPLSHRHTRVVPSTRDPPYGRSGSRRDRAVTVRAARLSSRT